MALTRINNNSLANVTSAGIPVRSGSVLQTLSSTKIDIQSITSTSYVDVTDLSVAITPTSADSKFLIMLDGWGHSDPSSFFLLNIVRDSTVIAQPDQTVTYYATMIPYDYNDSGYGITSISSNFLDSPATTDEITYKIQAKTLGGTASINTRPSPQNGQTISTLTVMEIAG